MPMTPYSKIDQPEVIALLFPPQREATSPCPANAEDVVFEVGSDVTLNCRYFFTDQAAPVLFFYPATDGTAEYLDTVAEKYLNQGMNVFLASYRGCGSNSGSPSVAAMYADSEKLFHLATAWLKDKGSTGHLFVMGQSLGSICAIDTVFKNGESVKGLIIESGICDTAAFLEAKGASIGDADIS